MTTALQIVNRAAELLQYKDPQEALSGDDASNFLGVLNSLLGTWNTDRLYVPATTTVNATVSASPVSIGTGQTLNTSRPVRILSMWVRLNGVDYPVDPMMAAEYDAVSTKSVTATQPTDYFYAPTVPYGSISLYPVPSAAISLYARVMVQLTEFANLATDYDLGSGYKRALEYSLAEELAPGRRALDPQIARLAFNARRALRVANFEPVLLTGTDAPASSVFNILAGE